MELIRTLIAWVGAHPNAAGITIGCVAFSESLAFVGLIVPGAMILFAAGALIADGALPFWPIVSWAAAGAILGDGISYMGGRHYRERIRLLWPFSKHPGLLQRGEKFFRRHGGKSIVLGRFVGPVRPVVPIVAGMLGMPPLRFYSTNILSGIAWAPSYLLPGMAFGASLALAGKVAERLAALLGSLLIAIWLIAWLVHALFRFLQPHAADWARQALSWSREHRGANRLIGDLIDPSAPASRALLLWIAVLIAVTWLFFGVLQDVIAQDPLLRANEAIYQMLQGLRTPMGDRIMVGFSQLGDWPVTTATTLAALAWLAWRRAGRDAAYWLTAIAFAWCSVLSLKLLLHLPRPVAASGAEDYSFPSAHATMSVVIYGYLTVLGARDLAVRWRWIPYAAATLLIAGISFSRLYLGVHWLSDVLAGLAMGMAGMSVVAIARQRHIRTHPAHGILWIAVGALLVSGVWHARSALATDLQRYAVHRPTNSISESAWWRDGWQRLPPYRIDLGGGEKQPLNVQWAGALSVLRGRLRAAGWQRPMPLRLRSALRWLSPDLPLAELPLLPQLHDGRREALSLILNVGDAAANRQLLLRLWPSSYRLEPGGQPVWVGTVAWLRIQRLPFLRLPRTMDDYDDALTAIRSSIEGIRARTGHRPPGPFGGGTPHATLIAVAAGAARSAGPTSLSN